LELCTVPKKKKAEPKKATPKAPVVHVGALLREHILAKGLNQAEIARRSFMTPQALSGAFKRASVQLETLVRISLATEHDFLMDISMRTMGTLYDGRRDASDPLPNYARRSGRAPIRFVIEADPDDARTLKQVAELLRDLKG
jgi:transcriptional regulator with XRE-family HTH domain